MKICSTCKEEKDLNGFSKDKRMRDGLRSQCKQCHQMVTVAWRRKNPERVRENTKRHYTNNKEYYLDKAKKQWESLSKDEKKRRAEYHKSYYASKKEIYLENARNRRKNRSEEEKNKDYLKQKEYYEANKETIKTQARKRYEKLSKVQKLAFQRRSSDWRKVNREKTKAWSAVGNALLTGVLEKPIYCELCGVFDVKIHAHHHNYSLPLEVLWLCHDCHMTLHSSLLEQKRMNKKEEEHLIGDNHK